MLFTGIGKQPIAAMKRGCSITPICCTMVEGFRQNRKKAFSIFSNLYARGYHGAAFYMGLYYQNGDAVEQDYQKAREYYRIGALENDMYCICQLGTLYAQGYGVPKDYHAAFDYYKQAAKLGDALACMNLGYCYEVGQGVTQDIAIAKNYYRCAAEHGEQLAAAALQAAGRFDI